jgi:hypothetical protein
VQVSGLPSCMGLLLEQGCCPAEGYGRTCADSDDTEVKPAYERPAVRTRALLLEGCGGVLMGGVLLDAFAVLDCFGRLTRQHPTAHFLCMHSAASGMQALAWVLAACVWGGGATGSCSLLLKPGTVVFK